MTDVYELTHWVHRVDTVHKVSFPHVNPNLKQESRSSEDQTWMTSASWSLCCHDSREHSYSGSYKETFQAGGDGYETQIKTSDPTCCNSNLWKPTEILMWDRNQLLSEVFLRLHLLLTSWNISLWQRCKAPQHKAEQHMNIWAAITCNLTQSCQSHTRLSSAQVSWLWVDLVRIKQTSSWTAVSNLMQ